YFSLLPTSLSMRIHPPRLHLHSFPTRRSSDLGTGLAIFANIYANQTFGCNAGSSLTGFATQLHTQKLFSLSHIPISLDQCFFALHHGGISFLAQLFDH